MSLSETWTCSTSLARSACPDAFRTRLTLPVQSGTWPDTAQPQSAAPPAYVSLDPHGGGRTVLNWSSGCGASGFSDMNGAVDSVHDFATAKYHLLWHRALFAVGAHRGSYRLIANGREYGENCWNSAALIIWARGVVWTHSRTITSATAVIDNPAAQTRNPH